MRKTAIPLDDALEREDAWMPTVVLAREAAVQVSSVGRIEAFLVPGVRKIP